jgi:DNA-binding GntR family transcriptional regulator
MGRKASSRLTPASIADAIREQILRGDLAPGSSARQDELAQRFNVSRVPVREALRCLAAEGLMTWESQRGFRVALLSPEEAREILEIRSLLEVQALRLAFPNIGSAAIEAANTALETSERTTSLDAWSNMNAAFHGAILAPCGRAHLLALIQQLNNRVDRYIRLLVATTDYRPLAEREHRAILAALTAGSEEAAAILLRKHIDDTAVHLDRFLTARRADD